MGPLNIKAMALRHCSVDRRDFGVEKSTHNMPPSIRPGSMICRKLRRYMYRIELSFSQVLGPRMEDGGWLYHVVDLRGVQIRNPNPCVDHPSPTRRFCPLPFLAFQGSYSNKDRYSYLLAARLLQWKLRFSCSHHESMGCSHRAYMCLHGNSDSKPPRSLFDAYAV